MKELKITTENIAAANKQFLGEVNEYPLFEEAAEIDIINASPGEGECYGEIVNFRPGVEKLMIDKKELEKYKGKEALVRLKKAFNAKIIEANDFQAKANFVSYEKTNHPVISWIKEPVDVEIIMSDGSKKRGFSSKSILGAKGMIRFEGVGYANIEEKKGNLISCVFAHE